MTNKTEKQMIRSALLQEDYVKVEHPCGLTLLLYPMKGYSTAYAMFGTQYGSVDVAFKTGQEDDFTTVPPGIAHFLEHKLFESEDGDAFTRFSATGASANAYTSFDRTAYLFACSDNFKESLDILLDFVTKPYFTEETVQKEQGIIGQEIRMYDDSADWRVFFNLLGALYSAHPLRIDIAGTVESIAEIDAALLYRCYHTFYNLHNMVLTIAGNFDVDVVIDAVDRILPKAPAHEITRQTPPEPDNIAQRRVEQKLEVATPLFQLGFKGKSYDSVRNIQNQVLDEILLEIAVGEGSILYRRLYDKGLINSTFEYEVMGGRDYLIPICSGESRNPDGVFEAVCAELERLKAEGIDKAEFERAKRSTYGRYVGMFGKVEAVAGLLMLAYFAGVEAYSLLTLVADATVEQLVQRLVEDFDTKKAVLSVVTPPSAS